MPEYTANIPEVTYLSVPGVVQYRTIMRKMFIENERMHQQLYKEEIMKLVQEDPDFEEYSMDNLKQDLDQLVTWGNLIAIQDPGIVHTIAEYKNKRYQYSMSEKAIEIERMAVRLENLEIESSNLSVGYFQRIEDALKSMEKIQYQSDQEIYEWWDMFKEDFSKLNQNYKDYLRNFYTSDSKTLMQSVEFIIHKDQFIQYLNNFIKQMQMKSRKIKVWLEKTDSIFEQVLADKIVQAESEIPRIHKTEQNLEQRKTKICNTWLSVKRWFMSIDGQRPECDKILNITNEIIRSVIDNANMIVQMSGYGVSRKTDYENYLQLFMRCDSLEDAHCLSAHVFGAQHIQHFKSFVPIQCEDSKLSAFDREIEPIHLESHSRTYKEKRSRQGVMDRSMDKMMAKLEFEKEAAEKEHWIQKYVVNNQLRVSDIQDTIPVALRISILTWISIANMSASKVGNTEFGKKYRLIKEEGTCVLHCEDGDITMPKYILEFDV